MKKSFALLAVLAFTAAATHAQTTTPTPVTPAGSLTDPGSLRSPEQQTQNQANLLAKELGLSPDQQTKVQQLMAAQRQKMQATRQQAGGDRRATAQAMRAGRDKFETQLQGILTPDQFTKYQQLMAQRREQVRARRGQSIN